MKYKIVEIPEEIKDYLAYCPIKKDVVWTIDVGRGGHIPAGSPAGCKKKRSIRVKDLDKSFAGTRVSWFLNKGPIPEGYEVVCKDGNRSNLDIDNLEIKTYTDVLLEEYKGGRKSNKGGSWEQKEHRDSSSGVKGVGKHEGGWTVYAYDRENKKNIHRGLFRTLEEAIAFRQSL